MAAWQWHRSMKGNFSSKIFVLILTLFTGSTAVFSAPNTPSMSNVASPLTIPSYHPTNEEIVHPDVVYFDSAWNGYKFWMCMTPLPNFDESYENPSIVASNDGSTWEEPVGIANPIDPDPGAPKHNADCDLVYNPSTDKLHAYYWYEDNAGTSWANIMLRTSFDGVTWSAEQTALSPVWGGSQGVVIKDGTWYMYVVEDLDQSGHAIHYYTSSNGINWSSRTTVTVSTPNEKIWHLDAFVKDGKFWLLLAMIDLPYVSKQRVTRLLLAESADGVTWEVYRNQPLLNRSGAGWDEYLYRSSLIFIGDTVYLFYSGNTNSALDWYIGLTTGLWTTILNSLEVPGQPEIIFHGVSLTGINM